MRVLLLGLSLLLCSVALAREGWKTSGDPEIDKWFHDQTVPGSTDRCCDVSDGSFVEEDIRDGHYWVRWEKTKGEWLQVPDTAVINDQPNKWGQPAVWWGLDEDLETIYIKCFVPGAKA